MREHKRKARKPGQPVFDLDVSVPGLGAVTGKTDRFKCSAETREPHVLAERRRMVVDLGRRLLHDVLAARLAGNFTTEELALAYKEGNSALRALLHRSREQRLAKLRDEWILACHARSKVNYLHHVDQFIAYCGGEETATLAHLTTANVSAWLASLTDGRRGRAGRPISSNTAEATAARVRRQGRREQRKPRAIGLSTRNRYRASLSSFCTYLVNVAGALVVHPLGGRRLPAAPEPRGRMPQMTSAEWQAYCASLTGDPLAPSESYLVVRLLRHTGADVGEVLGMTDKDGERVPGLRVRQLDGDRSLPRVRLKRQKIARSEERHVPYPTRYMAPLLEFIREHGLGLDDEVFGHVNRAEFERAHARACHAVGRPDLTLKDFRHLAAISWAQAGVRLERIKEWLGHTSIKQTEVYARFRPDDDLDEPAVENAARRVEGR